MKETIKAVDESFKYLLAFIKNYGETGIYPVIENEQRILIKKIVKGAEAKEDELYELSKKAYERAKRLHPSLCKTWERALPILMEDVGNIAKTLNDEEPVERVKEEVLNVVAVCFRILTEMDEPKKELQNPCTDGKRHWWKDGWICDKCGLIRSEFEEQRRKKDEKIQSNV